MSGVIKNNGVTASGVNVNSGVGVSAFIPTSVGVLVKVEVGIVGVELGISVGIFVDVETGVGVASGVHTEQEKDRIAKMRMRWMCIFFMAFLESGWGILSRVRNTYTGKDR